MFGCKIRICLIFILIRNGSHKLSVNSTLNKL